MARVTLYGCLSLLCLALCMLMFLVALAALLVERGAKELVAWSERAVDALETTGRDYLKRLEEAEPCRTPTRNRATASS